MLVTISLKKWLKMQIKINTCKEEIKVKRHSFQNDMPALQTPQVPESRLAASDRLPVPGIP